jgi:hypothetical protein
MDELSPLSPTPTEIAVFVTMVVAMPATFAASYRRNRCLFGRTVAGSLAVATVSALFWPVWLFASVADRRAIAARWSTYRASRQPAPVAA